MCGSGAGWGIAKPQVLSPASSLQGPRAGTGCLQPLGMGREACRLLFSSPAGSLLGHGKGAMERSLASSGVWRDSQFCYFSSLLKQREQGSDPPQQIFSLDIFLDLLIYFSLTQFSMLYKYC